MSEHVDTICVQGGYQPGNGESRTPHVPLGMYFSASAW